MQALEKEKESAAATRSEHTQLAETVQQLRAQNEALQLRLQELEHTATTHMNDARELRSQRSAQQSAYEREQEQHRTQFEALQAELLRLRTDAETGQRSVGAAADAKEAGWRRDIEALQQESEQQREIVRQLRAEMASLLEELRRLSARNEAMMADKESDVAIIRDLHGQMSSYKRRYENARAELRSLKTTSQLWTQPLRAEEGLHVAENGAIADSNLSQFQNSIDELLAASRSAAPSNVLVAMKSVVLATTLITDLSLIHI